MPMWFRYGLLGMVVVLFSGCSQRTIFIFDHNNQTVGECIAGYDWHFYGLQDSIDYTLYQCAKSSIELGYRISDPSLLNRNFSLPPTPSAQPWNRVLAMKHFHQGDISESQLGYILAEIESQYRMVESFAEKQLASGILSQSEFEGKIKQARLAWLGE